MDAPPSRGMTEKSGDNSHSDPDFSIISADFSIKCGVTMKEPQRFPCLLRALRGSCSRIQPRRHGEHGAREETAPHLFLRDLRVSVVYLRIGPRLTPGQAGPRLSPGRRVGYACPLYFAMPAKAGIHRAVGSMDPPTVKTCPRARRMARTEDARRRMGAR